MPINSRRAAPRLPPDGVGLVDGSTLPSGDRGFESISLRRRVRCEPDFSRLPLDGVGLVDGSTLPSETSAGRSCWVQWPHPGKMTVACNRGTNSLRFGISRSMPGKLSPVVFEPDP